VERASKRRNISIKYEITVFVEREERLSFASCRACLDDEVGMHGVRCRMEWKERLNAETSQSGTK
jgi:hypothetical protein